MNKSVFALNPRIVRLSPVGSPPSPALIAIPETPRKVSVNVVAPRSFITASEITVMVLGVSARGLLYLCEDKSSTL